MGTFKRVCFELSALDRFDDDLIEAGVTTIELEAFPALETHNASWYYWVCLNSMMLLSNFILDSEVVDETIGLSTDDFKTNKSHVLNCNNLDPNRVLMAIKSNV